MMQYHDAALFAALFGCRDSSAAQYCERKFELFCQDVRHPMDHVWRHWSSELPFVYVPCCSMYMAEVPLRCCCAVLCNACM